MYILNEYTYDYHEFCTPIAVSKSFDRLLERAMDMQIAAEEEDMTLAVVTKPPSPTRGRTVERLRDQEIDHLRINLVSEI